MINPFAAAASWFARNGFYRMAAIMGFGSESASGENVSLDSMLGLSTVWACSKVLAESFSSLPCHLYEETKSGSEKRVDHPLYRVLHDAFNPEMTSQQGREAMMLWASNAGNAVARIDWRNGAVVGLYPIPPGTVNIKPTATGVEYWEIQPNGTEKPIPNAEVFHIRNMTCDGYVGMGIVQYAKNTIGAGLAAQKYAGKFFSNGGRVPGIIKLARNFSNDEEAKKFRADWEKTYGGTENSHKNILLTGDVNFTAMGISPRDAQFIEWANFSVPDVCRYYRMPPHMVMDLSRATFSNIEHQGIEYVNYTLMPWNVRWEQQIQLKLISPDMNQRLTQGAGRLYAKFNVDALMRGDFASRWAGYAVGLQNGVLCIDDVLKLEDMNILPNGSGQSHHIQLNMQTVPGTGKPTASELATLAKIDGQQASQVKAWLQESQKALEAIDELRLDVIRKPAGELPPITVNVDARQGSATVKKTVMRDDRGRITGVVENAE